jgi:hypothetical protein
VRGKILILNFSHKNRIQQYDHDDANLNTAKSTFLNILKPDTKSKAADLPVFDIASPN